MCNVNIRYLTKIIGGCLNDKRGDRLNVKNQDRVLKENIMLTYKGYVGKVEFDEEAEVFYGTVINTRDKITFQAECAKDLRKEFEKSVETYLEFCQELGEEPERPYSGKFVLRLPPEAHKKVSLAAQAANKSLNAWIADHIIESANRELSF